MKNGLKFGFVTLVILTVAMLIMATAAYAQGPTTLPPCSNGVQDGDETGVDCGGSCIQRWVVDFCDKKDNDNDCSVDEDCKGVSGVVTVPKNNNPALNQEAVKPTCSDGVQNQGELAVDCGGECIISAKEVCDAVDNDKDCYIDEAGVCGNTEASGTSANAPVMYPAEPGHLSEAIGSPEEQPGYPAEKSEEKIAKVEYLAKLAESTPAQVVLPASSGDLSKLEKLSDAEVAAYIEQNIGTDGIAQLRKLAEDNDVYIPKGESDVQLGIKYLRFSWKHNAELEAKFSVKEPTEKDWVDVLKQFSDEAYPKPVQSQSFFSKVASFFKNLFR